MSASLNLFLGRTLRERIGTVINWLLIATVAMLGLQIKWMSKSPNPAEWNDYSQEANDHLYSGPSIIQPKTLPVIAHRGGSVPGSLQAGPLERLDYSYEQGHRLFELDFSWSSDAEIVVKHDWKSVKSIPSLSEFLAQSPGNHASLEMVYSWMQDHPDAFIVTDCKKQSLKFFAKVRMERPELVPRFIPQIYQFKDYELAKKQGFRNIILTLYRCLSKTPDDDIVQFAKAHDLFAVTIPESRCFESNLAQRLTQTDNFVYTHTINDEAIAREVLMCGSQGVYSDSLHNEALIRIAASTGRDEIR
jgi:hypothetical protein